MSATDASSTARRISPVWFALAVGVAVAVWLCVQGSSDASIAAGTLAVNLIRGAPIALAWLAGAWGIGRLVLNALRLHTTPEVHLATGAAILLFLAHALGCLGAFPPTTFGSIAAWTPVAIGLLLGAIQLRGKRITLPRGPGSTVAFLAAPAIATLIVGASVAPGFIWLSEANGYDVLAYHLQLPEAWRLTGRLASLEHNVYSHLPSYMEAAYLQLAAMAIHGPEDIASGHAPAVFAAQYLHAGFAVAAMFAVRRLTLAIMPDTVDDGAKRFGAALGAIATIGCGWLIVTGASAYNEMPVLLGFAAAIAVAQGDAAEWRRSLLIGLLCGMACAAKPTALFMVVIPVATWMFMRPGWNRPTTLLARFAPAAAIGACYLAPWLIRNALATGNPVFPWLTDLFGTAHWTAEQVARWNGAHGPDGDLGHRLGLLFSDRGMLHDQWSILFALVAAALVWSVIRRDLRRVASPLGAILIAQIAIWLFVGHQQSRFLLPLLIPGATLVGVAAASLAKPGGILPWRNRLLTLPLVVPVFTVVDLLARHGPGRGLFFNVEAVNGAMLETIPDPPPLATFAPTAAASVRLDESDRLYLIGESRALYFAGAPLHHSTWDASPLGDALEATDGDVAAAINRLRDRGVTHLYLDIPELQRLWSDGWYDPRVTPDVISDLLLELTPQPRALAWPHDAPAGQHVVLLLELAPEATDE